MWKTPLAGKNQLPWTNQGFKKVLLHKCLKREDFTVWQVTFYAPLPIWAGAWQVTFYAPLPNEQGPGK